MSWSQACIPKGGEAIHLPSAVVCAGGWQLSMAGVCRTVGNVVVSPGFGKGFSLFAPLSRITAALVKAPVHASVTFADVRRCVMVSSLTA